SRDGGPQGDSGTSNRLMASLLEWTGDPANREVILVGATNRPDRIDNALNDRAQLVVPFLHATPVQLGALIREIAAQARLTLADELALDELIHAPALRAVSGRQIHALLELAGEFAWRAGAPAIRLVDLRDALAQAATEPTKRDRYWTLLALWYTTDDRLLPW